MKQTTLLLISVIMLSGCALFTSSPGNFKAGDCPSSCKISKKNVKLTTTVCATNEADAKTKAERGKSDAAKEHAQDSCKLDCSTRPGCAGPATCQEKWSNANVTSLNAWACTDTRTDCDVGGTKWNCEQYVNLKVTLKCKCQR